MFVCSVRAAFSPMTQTTTVLMPLSTTTNTPSKPYTDKKPMVWSTRVQLSSYPMSTLVSATDQRDIHQSVRTFAPMPPM
jgi:hypothetical protein